MKARQVAEIPAYTGPDGKRVQQMFAEIAHRYDFLNHFLSASIDRRWRKHAVAKVAEHLKGKDVLCADVCCGTGDLAIELHRRLRVPVVASDFCHPMLVRSSAKTRALGLAKSIRAVEGDSMALPFADGCFDAVTVGFGLRNLEDAQTGLKEMRRLLKHDGVLVVLEFSQPVVPVLRSIFRFYFHRILPILGAWISGQHTAYRYLPESVGRFLSQHELMGLMEAAGFRSVGYRNLSGGIAALHWGVR
jgi:demethylmenaquinone methyltransferase/2-methoxy-6-polyprenyl-1,4-benzoquinol methylase